MQEPTATNISAPQQFHRPSSKRASDPTLIRYLRCSVVLPNIPLQNATRVIAMFKCFRKVQPAGSRASTTPTIETLYSHFSRVWPKEGDIANATATQDDGVQSLVMYDKNCRVDFVLPVAADLPQSLTLPGGGSIYYTLQIQANLVPAAQVNGEASVYSQELVVPIPAPESAYSPSRLPRRITAAHMTGHAQEHFGILITPDISLHVSVPQEVHYARHQHSVFKIHLKLMPHPPEAKLPAIAKLEWKLTQKTQIGHLTKTTSDWPSTGVWPESPTSPMASMHTASNNKQQSSSKNKGKLGESKATLASGLISFSNTSETPAAPSRQGRRSSAGRHGSQNAAAQAKQAAAQAAENEAQASMASGNAEDAMMGGSRKDQYLYIALPEQSAFLQPMSEGNPFLETLHQLEIELFPFHPQAGPNAHSGTGSNALSKTFWHWKQSLSTWGKKNSGQETLGSATSARDRWQAEIPVKITLAFEEHDKLTNTVGTSPRAHSLSSTGPSPSLSQGSAAAARSGFAGPGLIAPGPGFGHGGHLAITTGA
jgi:hypothetical protein